MIHEMYDTFVSILKEEKKDDAVLFCLELLDSKKMSIEELYDDLLSPSLIHFECTDENKEICIWKEHTRTSIIRTILECTYPYIIERKKTIELNHQTVVVVTPSKEYHEIGAIIATHYFILSGFDAQYIGANTPKGDILSAVKSMKPNYIAIGVTNPYNIVITKQITEEIKVLYPETKIILGGQAFYKDTLSNSIVHDYILKSKEDILSLGKMVKQ